MTAEHQTPADVLAHITASAGKLRSFGGWMITAEKQIGIARAAVDRQEYQLAAYMYKSAAEIVQHADGLADDLASLSGLPEFKAWCNILAALIATEIELLPKGGRA